MKTTKFMKCKSYSYRNIVAYLAYMGAMGVPITSRKNCINFVLITIKVIWKRNKSS